MLSTAGMEEYILTAGVLTAFIGAITALFLSRHEIGKQLRGAGLKKWHILLALLIVALFIVIEAAVVKPTQQLFFDDVIYQDGAVDLLHMGQAWMCNYGTPTTCFIGQVFHEPVGTALNLAIGFLVLGVNQAAAFNTMFALAALAVLLTFLVTLVLFRNVIAAFFSELLMAMSPALLTWARPTTSDLPSLAYSLLAIFALIIFVREKRVRTFAFFSLSAALAIYMRADNILYVLLLPVMYIILDRGGIMESLRNNIKRISSNLLNIGFLVALLVVVVAIGIEAGYVLQQYFAPNNFGYQGSGVQNTCNMTQYIKANSTFGFEYFKFNICSNVLFWFNAYNSNGYDAIGNIYHYYIMQPAVFTVLGLIGAVALIFADRKSFYAIGIWLATFFAITTAFYAGSVLYGVDWRLVLSMIAQVSIFGGYGAYAIFKAAKDIPGFLKRRPKGKAKIKGKDSKAFVVYELIIAAIITAIIVYLLYTMLPHLGISTSAISQAPDARFYENFVYNDSHLINASCLVLSYDPVLFNLNNRSAAQIGDIYSTQMVENFTQNYKCLVIDYGYWCYTPNNLCPDMNNSNYIPIATSTFHVPPGSGMINKTFGFYYIRNASEVKAGQTNGT
jgi:hypothetical protein